MYSLDISQFDQTARAVILELDSAMKKKVWTKFFEQQFMKENQLELQDVSLLKGFTLKKNENKIEVIVQDHQLGQVFEFRDRLRKLIEAKTGLLKFDHFLGKFLMAMNERISKLEAMEQDERIEALVKDYSEDIVRVKELLEDVKADPTRIKLVDKLVLEDVKVLAKEQGKAIGAEIEGHLDQAKIKKGSTTAESGGNATGLSAESLETAIFSEHVVLATGKNSTAVGLKIERPQFSTTPFSDISPAFVTDKTVQNFIKELHFAKTKTKDFDWDHLVQEHFGRDGVDLVNEFELHQAGEHYDVILRNPRKNVFELQNRLYELLLQDKNVVTFSRFISEALRSLVKKKSDLKNGLGQIKSSESIQVLKDKIDSLRQQIEQLACLHGDSSLAMNNKRNSLFFDHGFTIRAPSISHRNDWITLPSMHHMSYGTAIAASFTSRPADWQEEFLFLNEVKKSLAVAQPENTAKIATASTVDSAIASPWITNPLASNSNDSGSEEHQPGGSAPTKK